MPHIATYILSGGFDPTNLLDCTVLIASAPYPFSPLFMVDVGLMGTLLVHVGCSEVLYPPLIIMLYNWEHLKGTF